MLIKIFLNNILPTFLVIGLGVLADRKLHVDKRTLSRLAIYVFLPCLVFAYIAESSADPLQFGQIILFVILNTLVMCGAGLGVGRLLGWSQRRTDALVLSVAFLNAGNFGLSVILFAFGDKGVEFGAIFYVASNLMCNTLAAFFAARGNGGGRKALLEVVKLPGLYAFLVAMALRLAHWPVPAPLLKPIALVRGATVPTMLLLLGIQLSQTRLGKHYAAIGLGVLIRLIGGALAGLGLAPLIGLEGLARNVVIVEAATPTAVNSALLAIQFDADAEYVTSVIFASTLLSSVTLTVLLGFLR